MLPHGSSDELMARELPERAVSAMKRPIGIDLGTTYSAMAYVDDQGNSAIIPNAGGKDITPSVLVYDGADLTVGVDAKIAATSSEGVAQFVKRSIGDSSVEWVFGSSRYNAVIFRRRSWRSSGRTPNCFWVSRFPRP